MKIEIIIIIIGLLYLIYKYIINKNDFSNNEINGENNNNDKIKVILCSSKWCIHCTSFKPIWEELVELFNNKFYFIIYDADTDKKNIQKYKVNGFPTILIEKNNEVINTYIGGRPLEELSNYLNSL
jgi:thioredoxin 1